MGFLGILLQHTQSHILSTRGGAVYRRETLYPKLNPKALYNLDPKLDFQPKFGTWLGSF